MKTAIISHEHRARGFAASAKVLRGGRRSHIEAYSTATVIKMSYLRRCPKCETLLPFRKMDAHRKECCAAGAEWFRALPLRDTGGVNIARMAGKLKFMDENDGL